MKKLIILLLATIGTFQFTYSQITFTGNITVKTQAEVDALAENYTHITGRLDILGDGGDISDLSKFSDLQDIGRRLLIQDCPLITDLTDFSSLKAVGSLDANEELVIRRMNGLTTLNGLQALTSVGRRVGIRQNAVLTTLEGLNNLVSIGENKINIGDAACGGDAAMSNPLLTDFCALQSLVSGVGVATLEAGGSCIDNATAFNPSFTDISNGNCAATLSVNEFAEGSYKIYPNPVSDILNIESKEKFGIIKVINVLGREVLSSKENNINVSNLPSGLYFVEISVGNKSAIKKIIKY